ncbi:SIMPL domain-containing protein [Flavobacterium macrobrachii]|uniref:SIMPL domain-containing protein n=1 Tax=Flavobacterium macrobrachii TaxID=591204 RepID=A0ABS2CYT8_9FLAO|nr:SIMPL domain-containing protein [Flavobacterium macrobrachii]MBM6500118.1 SIMPL domain-containing protein [Flavobacterium macrobrachii]
MKKTFFLISILASFITFSQEKNFIDKPYLEVQGKADTLVTPNRIYIDVLISEKDVKGKKSVEELENDMLNKLKTLGIDVDKNVAMQDMMSNYKKFFLKQTDIQKSKSYSILVFDAKTTSKVFIGLEEVGLSNVRIDKLEHSEEKKLQLLMNSNAIENAKANAISFTKPLGQTVGKAIFIGNVSEGIIKRNYTGSTIRIRGNSSQKDYDAKDYSTNIEFEKITISSEIGVRFALE